MTQSQVKYPHTSELDTPSSDQPTSQIFHLFNGIPIVAYGLKQHHLVLLKHISPQFIKLERNTDEGLSSGKVNEHICTYSSNGPELL